ncbi:hypothetical protein [Entomohabitans teleogrylli]|uniref:hypothetical protein n=1 Tax=Entomohabitans teleogrylli TaxID=1384589 RepID=UPI00073D7B5D|nr:hypothetical protein [Entomohabitans teleogrylli]
MKYYFISDDVFFLAGMQEVISQNLEIYSQYYFMHSQSSGFNFKTGDVVVLAVNETSLKRFFIHYPELFHCRLIIMLEIPVMTMFSPCFPWLLPKNITVGRFVDIIQKAGTQRLCQGKVSRQIIEIFNYLGDGWSLDDLSKHTQLPIKYLSQIKRDVYREYGLTQCNSAGILICRDVLRMKTVI